MSNIDRNSTCPCGSTKKYKHCCLKSKQQAQAKTVGVSSMVPAWLQIAMQNLRAGRLPQAKALYEQVLQTDGRQPEALLWMGVIAHKQNDSKHGLDFVKRAIELVPNNAFFYSTLGNVQKDMGEQDAAIASYKRALKLKPDSPDAYNNLGTVYFAQGNLDAAIDNFQKAIALVPAYAEALNNLGSALHKKGRPSDAITVLQQAISINPSYAQALFNLARVIHETSPEHAIPYAKRAVAANPELSEAWITLARTLQAQGNLAEARLCYDRCLELLGRPGIRVQRDLMIPSIMGTLAEVKQSRLDFEKSLERLIADKVTVADPLHEFCGTNFHLAYHGLNDKNIQIQIAEFYQQACPSLLYVAPHCQQSRDAKQKKRVGFLSRYIARHSVALSFSKIVEQLANKADFEIFLISNRDPTALPIQETYPNFQGQYVQLTENLSAAREEIAALKLDVLVYLDIGMEAFSYFLAFARLARVQCVAGGHPVTTGVPALDYYLSAEFMETKNGQNHYSEQLVRLPFGLLYFERPRLPSIPKSRKELGLPLAGSLYICPMVLHKLHPEFDCALERILQLDSSGHIILFSDKKFSVWQGQLEQRFFQTISSQVRSRVRFIPWVTDPQDFMRVIDASDVVLDPFHFGIGTTAIPVCSMGTPFVTKPSEFMRGRVGHYFCKLMDLMECVTNSTDEFAAKAVSIATDPSERARIKAKMLANNNALFMNPRAIQDASEFLSKVVDELDER